MLNGNLIMTKYLIQQWKDGIKGAKDLTGITKRGANVPGYVIEYLLGVYCATDNPEAIEKGLAKIKEILTKNYVKPEEVERLKSVIREQPFRGPKS